MSQYKLLVFDWDGTLSNSLGHIVLAMQEAIRTLALNQLPEEDILNIIGLGLDEAILTLYPELSRQLRQMLGEAYREHYRVIADTSPPLYPHAEETIHGLHAQGYYLAIATGKSRRGLDRALADSGLRDCFHLSRCAEEVFSKPHPGMLEEIMATLDTTAQQTLMIGDTEHDLQMANNAKVASVAVNYGAHDIRRLLELNPVHSISNLKELSAWLAGKTDPISVE